MSCVRVGAASSTSVVTASHDCTAVSHGSSSADQSIPSDNALIRLPSRTARPVGLLVIESARLASCAWSESRTASTQRALVASRWKAHLFDWGIRS